MAKLTPRFRKELPAAATEVDGATGVKVTDPETGTSFTFYEFEYDLAHQLDGKQDYDEVIAWAAANYQHGLSPEAIDEFSKQLGGLGFLDPAGARPGAESGGESAELEWNQNVNTDQFTGPTPGAAAPAKTDTSGGIVLSSRVAWPTVLLLVVIIACGQMVSHSLLFQAGRKGATAGGRRRPKLEARIERARARVASWGNKRFALLASSAVIGLPPFFLTCVAAGALDVRYRTLLSVGLVGRVVRFTALALIVSLF